jgi:hypothetical protein
MHIDLRILRHSLQARSHGQYSTIPMPYSLFPSYSVRSERQNRQPVRPAIAAEGSINYRHEPSNHNMKPYDGGFLLGSSRFEKVLNKLEHKLNSTVIPETNSFSIRWSWDAFANSFLVITMLATITKTPYRL